SRCIGRVAGAAREFHVIDHHHHHEYGGKHPHDSDEETKSKITCERSNEHRSVIPHVAATRRAIRSFIALMALDKNAGGSMSIPREMASSPRASAIPAAAY